LLLVQRKALDEAPYKLFGAVAKLAGITFWSLPFSYWFDKPWFLTEGRLTTVLIIPSSWGSQLGGYLPASATTPLADALATSQESPSKSSSPRILGPPLLDLRPQPPSYSPPLSSPWNSNTDMSHDDNR
jgi:hypothetical protein